MCLFREPFIMIHTQLFCSPNLEHEVLQHSPLGCHQMRLKRIIMKRCMSPELTNLWCTASLCNGYNFSGATLVKL